MLCSTVLTLASVYGAFAARRTWQPLVPCCMLLWSTSKCGFLGDDIGYFCIQRLFGMHVLRQFTRLWYFVHFLREGVLGYAQCKLRCLCRVLLGQGC